MQRSLVGGIRNKNDQNLEVKYVQYKWEVINVLFWLDFWVIMGVGKDKVEEVEWVNIVQ